MPGIYLDNNATTPPLPEVVAAMTDCFAAGHANAASQHFAGRAARRVLEEAREEIARLLGARTTGMQADRVVFTSGGTEANHLALCGLNAAPFAGRRGRIVVSAIEHPSVLGTADQLRRAGWDMQIARVSSAGVVDVEHLASLLTTETRLVSVMLGNNETGVLQPVSEIVSVCEPRRIPVHTDGVQVVGKLPVDFASLGTAALTVAAHKFHGPRGIGALLVRHDQTLEPTLFGGFQQLGLRPGTESVELAVGMATALRLWRQASESRSEQLRCLRDHFETGLKAAGLALVVNGESAARLPHTSNVSFVGRDRQALLMALDFAGVACSTGSACASGSSEPSPVLLAMGLPPEVIDGSLRFSFGVRNTLEEVDEAVRRVVACVRQNSSSGSGGSVT